MSAEPPIDEDYASEEDSDFAPDGAQADDASAASESGDEGTGDPSAPAAKRKRTATGDGPADADDYDNSGDEAIIHKGKKRQKKAEARDAAAGDDDGGEGGLVKTRSMRAAEKAERKTHAQTGPVTVDVDELWAQMTADPIIPPKTTADPAGRPEAGGGGAQQSAEATDTADGSRPEARGEKGASSLIKIKRTYNFAGKVHTEEKTVPRDSAEARVYLASLGPGAGDVAGAGADDDDEDEPPKRQPRKAFRSAFEPAVEGLARRADLQLGMAARLQMREQAKAKKLNVVEKSRMDWAGFVDQEGIKDELELAGKSKESYTSRQDFLARVEAKKEDDARRARMAGRV